MIFSGTIKSFVEEQSIVDRQIKNGGGQTYLAVHHAIYKNHYKKFDREMKLARKYYSSGLIDNYNDKPKPFILCYR